MGRQCLPIPLGRDFTRLVTTTVGSIVNLELNGVETLHVLGWHPHLMLLLKCLIVLTRLLLDIVVEVDLT